MVLGTLSLVQKGQTSGRSGHSGIVVYGGENIVFGAKGQTSGCSGCGGCIYHYSTASTAYYIHCVHRFDLFGPKNMSPPPYTTISLHPLV